MSAAASGREVFEEGRRSSPLGQEVAAPESSSPGKQTLAASLRGGGGAAASAVDPSRGASRGDDEASRAAPWDADDGFLAALGIGEDVASQGGGGLGVWSEEDDAREGGDGGAEGEPAQEIDHGGGGGGGGSDGGEGASEGGDERENDGESEGGRERSGRGGPAASASGKGARGEASGEAGGSGPGVEDLAGVAMPSEEGPGASSSPPPAPGATVDVAPPGGGGVGGDASSEARVEATARAGLAGASAPLPHLDKLQQAFGAAYDLSKLRARVGGGKPQAEELGATHFAFGTGIYFGHEPSLGEAAHEATHALLQQQGQRPANGHQQDPAAEEQADEVARRVEQGKPIGRLLSPRSGAPAVAAVQRQPTPGQELLQSSWALVNEPGIIYDGAGARLRNEPRETSSYVTLPQNTKVQIVKHNPQARWYAVVAADGRLGYIADWLVWRNLPEGNTNVYLIKKGDTPLTIARDHYGPHFNRWGQDLRFVVNALVYVNSKGRHNGAGGAGLAKPGSVSESWLKATAAEDVYIWLPSANYLNSIYEAVRKQGGGTGSVTFDTFAAAANKVGAFSALPSFVGGAAHGFAQCLGDTVSSIFGLMKSVFTGEIIEDVKKLWSALTKLTIKDVVDGLGGWAQSWAPRLTSDNVFVQGHAWGYFTGYIAAEIAMFALGGAALNAIKASKLATKLGQVISRVAPKLTAAVGRVTAAGRASATALNEAKAAVAKRYGQAVAATGEALAKARFSALIKAAVSAGVSAADAGRLAKILDAAGITAKKVSGWGADAFTKLASNPGTLAELEAALPLVKAGRIVGLEDWLKFSAKKTGVDAQRTAAELREARRLAKTYPSNKVNVGGDARAPRNPDGSPASSFDLSVDNAAGAALRSFEMTTVDDVVTSGGQLSQGLRHAVEKAAKRQAIGKPIPGALEAITQIRLGKTVSAGKAGIIEIAENGDLTLITKAVPPRHIPKGNIFEEFAQNAGKIKDNQLIDAVTIVDQDTGAIIARIERSGAVWTRK